MGASEAGSAGMPHGFSWVRDPDGVGWNLVYENSVYRIAASEPREHGWTKDTVEATMDALKTQAEQHAQDWLARTPVMGQA